MRRAARTDNNQSEIVKALRQVGMSVQVLSAVGKGCPDLLVGWRGTNYLCEIKDGAKVPSARPLTLDQQRWIFEWAGVVIVATSVEDAIRQIVGAK